jgi:hypothetical protein
VQQNRLAVEQQKLLRLRSAKPRAAASGYHYDMFFGQRTNSSQMKSTVYQQKVNGKDMKKFSANKFFQRFFNALSTYFFGN